MRSALEIREMYNRAISDVDKNGESDETTIICDVLSWVLDESLLDGYVIDHLDEGDDE